MSTVQRPAATTTDRVAPTADLTEAVWGLISAARRLRARRPAGEGELGTSELRVLGQLGALEAPSAIGEIGRLVGLNPASTSTTVDRLESAGLVERARDTADRRVVRVELTDLGRDTVRRRVAAWQAEWTEALADLPEEDLEVTARTLRAVARAVDAR